MLIDIPLTEAENLALSTIAVDPAGWIENFLRERVRATMDGIVEREIRRRLDAGLAIPASREEIVIAAFSEGAVLSAADQQSATEAQSTVPDAGSAQ